MGNRITLIAVLLLMRGFSAQALAADATPPELTGDFSRTVRPFLQTYCFGCHSSEKPEAELDLSRFSTMASVESDGRRWNMIRERLKAGEMPPADAPVQPSPELRKKMVDWIQSLSDFQAKQNAGDPGPVLTRRLSNAEYDYTTRDLTGLDIHPTKEFPVDPANEAGFDNSGESL